MQVLLLIIIGMLFSGAQSYKGGADRAACVLNQRNAQQAVRTLQNIKEMKAGDALDWTQIYGADKFLNEKPICPAGGAYTYGETIPAIGVQALKCSHAHGKLQHVPDNVTTW